MIPRVEKLGDSFYLEDGDCRSVKILNTHDLILHIEELQNALMEAHAALAILEERESNET